MLYEINDQQKELIQVALDAYVNSEGPRHFQTDIDVARATLDKPYKPLPRPELAALNNDDMIALVRRVEQAYDTWTNAVEDTFRNGESIEDNLRENIDYEDEYSELLNDLLDIQHFNKYLTDQVATVVKDYNRVVDWKREVNNDATLDGYSDWKRGLADMIMGAL